MLAGYDGFSMQMENTIICCRYVILWHMAHGTEAEKNYSPDCTTGEDEGKSGYFQ